MTTIITKNSSTAGAAPLAADLVQGELAVNVTSKALYTKNASAAIVKLNTPSIVDNGDATAITIDSSENVGVGTSSPSTYGKIVSYGSFPATGGGYSGMSVIDTTSGSGLTNVFNGSNFTDADFFVKITQVGASSKYALLGPSTNIPLALMTNNTERARIDSSGNLLVGTTSGTNLITGAGVNNGVYIGPNGFIGAQKNSDSCAYWAKASGYTSGVYHQFWVNNSIVGSISTNGTSTTYATSSDYRLKENVQPMTGALSVVQQLKPCTYKWKADDSNGQGFIAHELQAVVPDCVTGEKDAVDAEGNPVYQGIDTSFLVATLTAAIQELKSINDTQAQAIATLTERIAALEAK